MKTDNLEEQTLENFLYNEVAYPTNKYELMEFATEIDLDRDIQDILEELPDDHFDKVEEILDALPADYRSSSSKQDLGSTP